MVSFLGFKVQVGRGAKTGGFLTCHVVIYEHKAM